MLAYYNHFIRGAWKQDQIGIGQPYYLSACQQIGNHQHIIGQITNRNHVIVIKIDNFIYCTGKSKNVRITNNFYIIANMANNPFLKASNSSPGRSPSILSSIITGYQSNTNSQPPSNTVLTKTSSNIIKDTNYLKSQNIVSFAKQSENRDKSSPKKMVSIPKQNQSENSNQQYEGNQSPNKKGQQIIEFHWKQGFKIECVAAQAEFFDPQKTVNLKFQNIPQRLLQNYIQANQQCYQINKKFEQFWVQDCSQILSGIRNRPNDPLSRHIIYRLKNNLQFYKFCNQRHQITQKILQQNAKKTNKIEQINRISRSLKIDSFLSLYFLNKTNWQENKVREFILHDQTCLISIFQLLSQGQRVSDKKYLKISQQKEIQMQLINNYEYEPENQKVGKAIVDYFELILIKNQQKPNKQQIQSFYLPLLTKLSQKLSATVTNNTIKQALNNLQFEIYVEGHGNFQGDGFGAEFKTFIACILNGKECGEKDFGRLFTEAEKLKQFKGKVKDIMQMRVEEFLSKQEGSYSNQPNLPKTLFCLFYLQQIHKLSLEVHIEMSERLLKVLSFCNSLLFIERLTSMNYIEILEERSIPIIYNCLSTNNKQLHQKQIEEVTHIATILPSSLSIKSSLPQIVLSFILKIIANNLGISIDNQSSKLPTNFIQKYSLLNNKLVSIMGRMSTSKQVISMKVSSYVFRESYENQILEVMLKFYRKFRDSVAQSVKKKMNTLKILIKKFIEVVINSYIKRVGDSNKNDSVLAATIDGYETEITELLDLFYGGVSTQSLESQLLSLEIDYHLCKFYTKSLLALQTDEDVCPISNQLINTFIKKITFLLTIHIEFKEMISDSIRSQILQIDPAIVNSLHLPLGPLKKSSKIHSQLEQQQHNKILDILVMVLDLKQILNPKQSQLLLSEQRLDELVVNRSVELLVISLVYIQQKLSNVSKYEVAWPINVMNRIAKQAIVSNKKHGRILMNEEKRLLYGLLPSGNSYQLLEYWDKVLESLIKYMEGYAQEHSHSCRQIIQFIYLCSKYDQSIFCLLVAPKKIISLIGILKNSEPVDSMMYSGLANRKMIRYCLGILSTIFEQGRIKINKETGNIWKKYLCEFIRGKERSKNWTPQCNHFISGLYYMLNYLTEQASNQTTKLLENSVEFITKNIVGQWDNLGSQGLEDQRIDTKILTIYAYYVSRVINLQSAQIDSPFKQDQSIIFRLTQENPEFESKPKAQNKQVRNKVLVLLETAQWVSIYALKPSNLQSQDHVTVMNNKLAVIILSKVIQYTNQSYFIPLSQNHHSDHSIAQFLFKIYNLISQILKFKIDQLYRPKLDNLLSVLTEIINEYCHQKLGKSIVDRYRYYCLLSDPSQLQPISLQRYGEFMIQLPIAVQLIESINYFVNDNAESNFQKCIGIYKLYWFLYYCLDKLDNYKLEAIQQNQKYKQILQTFFGLTIKPLIPSNLAVSLNHDHKTWHLIIISVFMNKMPNYLHKNPKILSVCIKKLLSYFEQYNKGHHFNSNYPNISQNSIYWNQFIYEVLKFSHNLHVMHFYVQLQQESLASLRKGTLNLIMRFIELLDSEQKNHKRKCPKYYQKYNNQDFVIQDQQSLRKYFEKKPKSIWDYYQDSLNLNLIFELLNLAQLDLEFLDPQTMMSQKIIDFAIQTFSLFEKVYIMNLNDKNFMNIHKFINDCQQEVKIKVQSNFLSMLINKHLKIDALSIKTVFNHATESLLVLSLQGRKSKQESLRNKTKKVTSLFSSIKF